MIEEKRTNLSNSGSSRSMEPWPLRKFDNFDQEFMKKKVSKSQNRPSLGDFPQVLDHYGGFEGKSDFFGATSKLTTSRFQQNVFTNDRRDNLNFSRDNLPFEKLYHRSFEKGSKNRSKLFNTNENTFKVREHQRYMFT